MNEIKQAVSTQAIGQWESDIVKIESCERSNIPQDVLDTFNARYPNRDKDIFTAPTNINELYALTAAHMVKTPKWGYFEEYWCIVQYERRMEWATTPPTTVKAITIEEIRRTTALEEYNIRQCHLGNVGG